MGVYTGTVPTFLAGELPDADKFTEVSNFMTAATAAWTTWLPTLTALTAGNGTTTAKYRQLGKTVDYRFKFVLGTTSAVGTSPRFSLPAAPHADYVVVFDELGHGVIRDVSAPAERVATVLLSAGSTVEIFHYSTTGGITGTTATVPWTWATGDVLSCTGTYEVA